MNRARASRGVVALLLPLAALATACGSSSAPAGSSSSPGQASLTLELDWVPNPDHVALYYALRKGYFTREHVNVKFDVPGSATDAVKLVGVGKVDLAISYETEMFFAQQAKLPVTAVATVIPVPLDSLIVSPKVHLTRLSQIKGKKIGLTGLPSDGAVYSSMIRTLGLKPSDVPATNVGYDLVTSVLSGKVDAIIGGYRNVEAIQIAQTMGQQPTVFPASDLGVPSYAELVLVANRPKLASDPGYADAVRRFVKAMTDAAQAAQADPAGATAIMQKVSQYKPQFLRVSVPTTLKLLAPAANQQLGCIYTSAWQGFGDWMKQTGLITITPDASLISTPKYLPYRC